jgi:hypothetical protein
MLFFEFSNILLRKLSFNYILSMTEGNLLHSKLLIIIVNSLDSCGVRDRTKE